LTQIRHQSTNAYLQAEWTPTETVTATLGLQRAAWTVTSAQVDLDGTTTVYPRNTLSGTTPRLALVWQPSPVDILKALYGGGYRNPTLFEAYYSDLGTFVANPQLMPERISTLQGIWVRSWPSGLQTQLSASRSWWHHLVEAIDLGGGMQQFQNADQNTLVGTALEAEGQGRWGAWSCYGQAGLYRWEEAGQRFADSATGQASLRLTRRWRSWSASAEVRYVGARPGPDGVAGVPAATVLRLASRWEGPRCWLRATVEDAGQARPTDLVAVDYLPITRMFADGRTFFLTVGVPF